MRVFMWVKIDFVAFTVSDFQDLLDILQSNRAWRDDLRRILLDEEIARVWKGIEEMRESMRELIELHKQNEKRFARIESDISVIKSDVTVLKTDVAVLKTDVAVLKTDVAELKGDMTNVKTSVASLKGDNLERAFRERPFVYLSRFALRLRNVDDAAFAILIEDAIEQGRITEAEAEELKLLDAVAKGKSKQDGRTIYFALEVSYVADMHDLERAQRRAALLAKATGEPAQAVVAGNTILSEVRQVAEQRGVYYVIKE